MQDLMAFLVVAAVIEAVWEQLKPLWPRILYRLEEQLGLPVDRLGVLLVALAACFGINLDLPASLGVPFSMPVLGTLLTGVLAGRLSNLWHDLLGVADGVKRDKKPLDSHSGM